MVRKQLGAPVDEQNHSKYPTGELNIKLPSNCYFWCAYKYMRYGGTIKFYKSLTWAGYHTTWVDPEGVEWEYTMRRMRKVAWWVIPIVYFGVVREFKPNPNKGKKR